MKKQFENIEETTDRSTYDAAMKYLNDILDDGALTKDEFEAEKKKLLAK